MPKVANVMFQKSNLTIKTPRALKNSIICVYIEASIAYYPTIKVVQCCNLILLAKSIATEAEAFCERCNKLYLSHRNAFIEVVVAAAVVVESVRTRERKRKLCYRW